MNLITHLTEDHDRIRNLISRLEQQSDTQVKRQLFNELLILVRIHLRSEESAVYARLLKLKDHDTSELALEGYDDHQLLEDYVYKIKASSTDETWLSRVNTYCQILQLHLAVEESDLFYEIQQRFSDFDLQQCDLMYVQAKKANELDLRSADAFAFPGRFF